MASRSPGLHSTFSCSGVSDGPDTSNACGKNIAITTMANTTRFLPGIESGSGIVGDTSASRTPSVTSTNNSRMPSPLRDGGVYHPDPSVTGVLPASTYVTGGGILTACPSATPLPSYNC
jgi:hypothetical protein